MSGDVCERGRGEGEGEREVREAGVTFSLDMSTLPTVIDRCFRMSSVSFYRNNHTHAHSE